MAILLASRCIQRFLYYFFGTIICHKFQMVPSKIQDYIQFLLQLQFFESVHSIFNFFLFVFVEGPIVGVLFKYIFESQSFLDDLLASWLILLLRCCMLNQFCRFTNLHFICVQIFHNFCRFNFNLLSITIKFIDPRKHNHLVNLR